MFLDNLLPDELAALGVIVEVIGHGYFTMTQKARDSPEQWSELVPAFTTHSAVADDTMNDRFARECMCVFEDLVQRNGFVLSSQVTTDPMSPKS